jgi:hypothetical protein
MKGWLRQECKEVYKIICITHPMDLYDYLCEVDNEPYSEPLLTHDKLINITFNYILDNGSDSFFEWIMQQEGIN